MVSDASTTSPLLCSAHGDASYVRQFSESSLKPAPLRLGPNKRMSFGQELLRDGSSLRRFFSTPPSATSKPESGHAESSTSTKSQRPAISKIAALIATFDPNRSGKFSKNKCLGPGELYRTASMSPNSTVIVDRRSTAHGTTTVRGRWYEDRSGTTPRSVPTPIGTVQASPSQMSPGSVVPRTKADFGSSAGRSAHNSCSSSGCLSRSTEDSGSSQNAQDERDDHHPQPGQIAAQLQRKPSSTLAEDFKVWDLKIVAERRKMFERGNCKSQHAHYYPGNQIYSSSLLAERRIVPPRCLSSTKVTNLECWTSAGPSRAGSEVCNQPSCPNGSRCTRPPRVAVLGSLVQHSPAKL